ncbi:MAG: hypothetical protein UU21_C0003G0011 [Candidatus Levybacteria bacterium GW2011_GWA2_40_8]|nr:MAG: hypothetical protein UU21_C0003G0011 [Candidatus Levybacteria bacterium GW2011_GWA2_40_8]
MFDLIDFFQGMLNMLFLIKVFILLSILIYIMFLLVVVKQVNSMSAVIREASVSFLRNFAVFMVALGVLLLLTALVIL